MSEAGRIVVFAGPCRPREGDRELTSLFAHPRVSLRPPAARGDVLNALSERPAALVVLDGLYYSVPAVTHKEILYALDEGVPVIGASSMGALRAAELDRFGMVGVGEVYERFRSGEIDGDDEVAVLHGPAEAGFRAMSLALVEIRGALERIEREGKMRSDAKAELIRALRRLPFVERRVGRLRSLAEKILTPRLAAELLGELDRSSAKRRDAALAVSMALGGLPEREPAPEAPTAFVHRFLEEHLWARRDGAEPAPPAWLSAWRAVQVLHPGAASVIRAGEDRRLFASAAAAEGLEPDAAEAETLMAGWGERLTAELGASLPRRELEEEARITLLAARFAQRVGQENALARAREVFARSCGLAPAAPETEVDDLVAAGREALSEWSWTRYLALTPAAFPALEVARAASEVHRCFERWAGARRATRASLREVGAELWSCAPDEVPARAEARGLFGASLYEALASLAAAERLERAINGYPEAKQRLLAAPLKLEAPGVAGERSLGTAPRLS